MYIQATEEAVKLLEAIAILVIDYLTLIFPFCPQEYEHKKDVASALVINSTARIPNVFLVTYGSSILYYPSHTCIQKTINMFFRNIQNIKQMNSEESK